MGRAVVIALLLAALGLTAGVSYELETDRVSELAGDSESDVEDDTTSPEEGALPPRWSPPRVATGHAAWPPLPTPHSRCLPVSVPPPTA